MEIFLVGGAVRDKLLGLEVKDHDWLVVGGNPEYFLERGYEQVGADFPVFLHPETKDEYALARTERKIGGGYSGFETNYDSSVTIEEDLERRDLTINAIAQRENGDLIDPYNGVGDLKRKVLRHVSDSFKEDPLRVLRVARFMARYASQGFTVHPETMDFMREMVKNGEVDHLVPERVFKEMVKSFDDPAPSKFFEVLKDCGALKVIFPEIDRLVDVPQTLEHHPEGCCFIHTMMVLDKAKEISNGDHATMYAALVHDLGKGLTPKEMLPRHLNHEKEGMKPVAEMSDRLKVPSEFRKLGILMSKNHLLSHRVKELKPKRVYELIKEFDVFRNNSLIYKFLDASMADAQGRLGFEDRPYPQREYINGMIDAVKSVSTKSIVERGLKGKEFGEALDEDRLRALLNNFHTLPEKMIVHTKKFKNELINYESLDTEGKYDLFSKLKVSSSSFVLIKIMENLPEVNKEKVLSDVDKFNSVNGRDLLAEGIKGEDIGIELKKRKLEALTVKKISPKKKSRCRPK